ncbi:hypothetical protein ACP275_12G140100 [Erythranthe tilingii]
MDADQRVGYEHHYSFSIDDEILSLYNYKLKPGRKTYLVEIRARFIMKKRGDDENHEIINSERYKIEYIFPHDLTTLFSPRLYYRLEEYWMTEEEALVLEAKVVDFAKQTMADINYANRQVIPIVISIDVCTVQQDGEAIGCAYERAIRVENLVPISTWDRSLISYNPYIAWYLFKLQRFIVKDVIEAEVCGICRKDPRIGVQMSVMPCCNHSFHSNCVSQWISANNMCPYCNSPTHLQDQLY